MDTEDQRDVELSTLSAIYPEIRRLHEDDPYSITISLPVNPAKAATVFFPAATVGLALNTAAPPPAAATAANGHVDSHEIAHLPAVHLEISLPASYPTDKPPAVSVSTTPSWLPAATAKALEDECARLWEDLGRDLVVFSYIDHVQHSADDVFGLVSDSGALEIQPEHKIAVLDYDIEAKRRVFNNETFFCGICLDPKKGIKCHRMIDCGHVFCLDCLQDFYNNAIKKGELVTVRCLEPGCTKKREGVQAPASKKRRKPNTKISPNELLQMGLSTEIVKRYVTLTYKTELESDKNVVYCPRETCQGPARSKHKKPKGFELYEAEEDLEDDNGSSVTQPSDGLADRLAVCEDCGFAFCNRCNRSWHGDYVICRSDKEQDAEHSADEKASLEFINLHTSPCPTCSCPAQKTSGCNHMICYRCNSHFCYLCSAWLDPVNPYQHYGELPGGGRTSCYMRLWELEEGDENGAHGFAGGRGAALQEMQAIPHRPVAVEHHGDGARPAPRARAAALNGEVAVTHEGPLVLRLGAVAPPREEREVPAAPALVAPPPLPGHLGFRPRPRLRPQQAVRQDMGPGARIRVQQRAQAQRDALEHHDEMGQQDQMGADDAAWVRQFVQLALEDNEDLLDEDE